MWFYYSDDLIREVGRDILTTTFDDKYLIVSYQKAQTGICTSGLKQNMIQYIFDAMRLVLEELSESKHRP